jgi:hypothetical protein
MKHVWACIEGQNRSAKQAKFVRDFLAAHKERFGQEPSCDAATAGLILHNVIGE